MVHDLSGWAMVFLAYGFLVGVFRVLEWAEIPVMQSEPTTPPPMAGDMEAKTVTKGAAA